MDIYDDDDILKILDILSGQNGVLGELNTRIENIEAAIERSDDVVTSHTERIDELEAGSGEENLVVTNEELEELLASTLPDVEAEPVTSDEPGIHPKVPESLFMPFIYVPGATEPLRICKRLRRNKPNDDNWRLSIHDIERLVELCKDILEREAKW